MDADSESRIVRNAVYPKIVYLEALLMFFGANYIYHQQVFRRNNNKYQFLGFILANIFTSYNFAEATNLGVARYYAALYNNTMEIEHRAKLS